MTRFISTFVCLLWFLVLPVHAQTPAPDVQQGLTPEILAKLKQGGLNIFFRHGLTLRQKDPQDRDIDTPEPGNCSLQRNLSDEGVAQMRAIGAAFDSLEIPVGTVRTSLYCRCVDSAWHAFGRFERDRNLMLNGDTPEGDQTQLRPWNHIRRLG
jgi:hypothetical protein